jgi:hypothetical protein
VALQEPEIGSSVSNILIDNNCTDDKLDVRMPGASRDYEDEGDENHVRDAIPTASRRQRPVTEFEMFDKGTSDVKGYEDKDGDNADADDEDEASQAYDGSKQNVED